MYDEGAVWIVKILIRLKDGSSWEGTGFKRMGGHLTFMRAADTSTKLSIVNRTSEAPPGANRKTLYQGVASAGWSATFDDPTKAAVAIGLNSDLMLSSVAASVQIDLADYAPAEGDFWYASDGHNNVTESSVVRANGLLVADSGNAAEWVTETARAVGDYIIPTTNTSPPLATDHFYKVVSGTGDSGITEPEYPADGTTVVDGDLTLQDMGLVIASDLTDYRVSSAKHGEYVRMVGSSLVTSEPILTSYDYAALDSDLYQPSTEYSKNGFVKVTGYNEIDMQNLSYIAPNAQIFGTTALDAGSRAVSITGFDVSPQLVDPANPPPGTPANWDYSKETERMRKWFD
ncbi:MAG: hypothetical protein JRC99_00065 [Deltaproteobacteria bacterium]|nr:hypothetical protein [Deltaproteobacteria bacterium]